ncbi:MAG: HAMP domain-containing histidine kinase [Bacteroidales bacterium]|nr:HAMP domain-containing histidine kinase [Bacteroidales bacterium]
MNNISDYALLKELQRRLKRSDDLSAELYHNKNELLELNQKLEESEMFKSHFISNVTNELVNPVSSLLALSKFLKNNNIEDKEKIKKFSSLIFSEAFDIDFQLRNVFFAAKFESGKYIVDYTTFSVVELVKSILKDFEHLFDKKNVTADIELKKDKLHDNISTDAEKLKVVFANIISNSVRFSNTNDKIIIKISIIQDTLQVSIRDFGIGISPDLTDKVFERFYRIDNSINSENKGSGLGLSVSKQIIEILGGSIRFEDHDNGVEVLFNISINQNTENIDDFSSNGNEFFFDGDMEVF